MNIDDIKLMINEKLSKRERMYLLGGGIFALVFIIVVFIFIPLGRYNNKIEKNIDIKERQLKKVYEIGSKIKAIENANKSHMASRGDFTVFGYLEDLAEKEDIKNRIEYMKPVAAAGNDREAVEIRIKGVFEASLISFLYGIENSPVPLKINRFSLRRNEKDKNLDVTFQVQING